MNLLETFAKVIAPASFAFLALTVVYEWGFFLAVGRQFQPLESATDYLTNAILWLPYSVIVLLGFIDFKAGPEKPEKVNKSFHLINVGILVLGIVALAFVLYSVPVRYAASIALSFAALWFAVVYSWFAGREISPIWYNAIRSLPPLVVGAVALGYAEGQNILFNIGDVYTLRIKSPAVEQHIAVLRSFDKGLLIRDYLQKKVVFYRWEEIVSLHKSVLAAETQTAPCLWFTWFCSKPDDIP